MRYFPVFISLSAILLFPGTQSRAANVPRYMPEAGSRVELEKGVPWAVTPNPALPNVLILGDSISIGYTLSVRRLLEGKANVFRPISSNGRRAVNCGGTGFAVKHLSYWLTGHKWTVIYFNWGLHELKHVIPGSGKNSNNPKDPLQATVAEYSRNLEAIVAMLKATGARLVFATTTPVPPDTFNPLRDPGAPALYNAAAVKIMKANGVRVDDLYTLCKTGVDKCQLPRNVHFNSVGWAVLARHVALVIKQELAAAATDGKVAVGARQPNEKQK